MRLNPCDTAFKKRLIPRSVPIRPEKNIIDADFVAQGHAVLDKTFKHSNSCDFIDRDSFSKLFVYNKFPQTISLQLLISNIVSCIQNLNKSRLIFYDKNFLLKGIITFILPQIFWSESMDARESVHSKRLKSGGWKGGCVSMT